MTQTARRMQGQIPMHKIPRDDGRFDVRPINAPLIDPFPVIENWSPRVASQMMTQMVKYWRSPFGLLAADELCNRIEASAREDPWNPDDSDPAASKAQQIINLLIAPDLPVILADAGFADMMVAASKSAPPDLLKQSELIAPSGFLFFEQEQNLTPTGFMTYPIRAISWDVINGISESGALLPIIEITMWSEGHMTDKAWAQSEPQLVAPIELTYALYATGVFTSPMESSHPDVETVIAQNESELHMMNAILRSINAIAQSPLSSSDEISVETPKIKKFRIRKGKPAPRDIRVLSLHNREHGRYELDAATGRKLRAHWVRGHWRNQWYAKTNEHQTIWIDGFVKGDAERGTPTGPKVYVARAPQAEEMDRTQTNN